MLNGQRKRSSTPYQLYEEKLSRPTHFGEIYEAAVRICTAALGEQRDQVELTFHLSPGTPAMAAVWIILAKTRFPAKLIESSREHGVQTASIPFDISAEFLPDLLRKPDEQLRSAQRRETYRIGKFCQTYTTAVRSYGAFGRESAASRVTERSRFARRRIRHWERTFCPCYSPTQS